MNIGWEYVETFLAVAEEKSFSGAARRLHVTQPTVSRRVSALEEQLTRALFRRDVEGAHLTEEGAKILPAAIEMSRFSKELEQIASSFDDHPAGTVRIALPPATAYEFIVPFARDLKNILPDVQVHAVAGVDQLDLSRGHAELAIRNKAPTQPDLMILAQGKIEIGVFASKAYASRAQGKKFEELDWVAWSEPNTHLEPNPSLEKMIPGFRPAFASNDFNVQTRAVAEGLGVMILSRTSHKNDPYPAFRGAGGGSQAPRRRHVHRLRSHHALGAPRQGRRPRTRALTESRQRYPLARGRLRKVPSVKFRARLSSLRA